MADETVKLRHTAEQVDDGIDKANAAAPKSTVYTKTEVDTALAAKADSSDVYDKDAVGDLLEGKVDVETGKGLSTNDYTNAEKSKLANLENYDDTEVKTSIASVRNTAEETSQEVEDARGTYTSLGERLDDMGGGGGGGTSNYNQLTNKPSINGVTLTGNKTTSDLRIEENVQADWDEADSKAPSYIKNKPNIPSGVVVDTTYDGTSENAQAGTAVAQAISTKVDKVTGKGLSTNDFTNTDKANLETALTKANSAAPQSTTYTKTEVDAALAAKLNTSDVDAALSSTSTNPVQNKVVQAPVARLVDAGAKNIFDPTVVPQTETRNGVTITRTENGIHVSGTVTATSDTAIANSIGLVIPSDGYRLYAKTTAPNLVLWMEYKVNGSSIYAPITRDVLNAGYVLNYLYFKSLPGGVSFDVDVDLMLCTAEDHAISPEFVPHTPTMRELYEMILAMQNGG